MDIKLIRKFGTEILCYRIRTERQRKRMQYKDFDKQLIALFQEQKDLFAKRRNLGFEPLVPPVQKGWKRFFVLRHNVARSKQAQYYENILRKINTYDWSHRKDFKIKKRKYGRKIYVVKGQELQKPWESHFKRLGLTDAEKQFFHEEYHYDKRGHYLSKRYVVNEPWRFKLNVCPNIIDKVKIRDAVLEARLKQIDTYLERNDYQKRLDRILYGASRRWRHGDAEKFRSAYIYKNKSLTQIMDLIAENDAQNTESCNNKSGES